MLVLSEKWKIGRGVGAKESLDEAKSERILSSEGESKHIYLAIGNEDNGPKVEHLIPSPAPVIQLKKKLLVLDLNGILVDVVSAPPNDFKADIKIARRAIFRRPFSLDFLKFCFERFEVGIWSSRRKKNIDRIVDYLMGDLKQKLLFIWDSSYCTVTQFRTLENMHKTLVFKDLGRLWEKHDPELSWEKGYFHKSNTLLVDDSPYKALLNPVHTAIFPLPFQFQHPSDGALGDRGELRLYLQKLAEADSIPEFVAANPFGQAAITDESDSWEFYHQVINSLRPTQQA